METVTIVHNREGQTLSVWFADPLREVTATEDDSLT